MNKIESLIHHLKSSAHKIDQGASLSREEADALRILYDKLPIELREAKIPGPVFPFRQSHSWAFRLACGAAMVLVLMGLAFIYILSTSQKMAPVDVVKVAPPLPPPLSPAPSPPSPSMEAKERVDADKLLAEAHELARKGDWQEVREHCEDAIHAGSWDLGTLHLKGIAELKLGLYQESLQSLSMFRDMIGPGAADAHLLLSLLEAHAGLPGPNQEAIARLEDEAIAALKKEPQNCNAAVKLLGHLDRDGRESDVLAVLAQAEAQNCKDPFIEKMHQEYLVRRPKERDDKVQEIYKAAKAAFDGDEFAQAALLAEEAFKLKPLPEIGFLLAESYKEMGKAFLDEFEASPANKAALDKAIMNVDRGLEILAKELKDKFPDSTAAARTYRARCFVYLLGSLAKVDEEVKGAVTRDLSLIYHQAESYFLLGERVNEPDRSAAFLKVIWRLSPFLEGTDTSKDARGPFLMGQAYLKLGKPENFNKAINYFLAAERLGMKKRPELYDAMGDAYLGLGEFIKAAQTYRESFHALPTEEACKKSATCFIKADLRVPAEHILMEGLKSFPSSKTLKQLLDSIRR